VNNWILSKIITIWVQIRDTYLYLFRHALIINAYVDDHTWFGIRHRNWGDDLNYYFIKEITGRPVIIYHNFKLAKWLHLNNYLCIGTLLDGEKYKNNHTIIWGSGYSGADRSLTHPQKVMAVRGPKSRDYLLFQGIECPKVYGDLALLLPLVYKASPPALPRREGTLFETRNSKLETKRYRLGIIPHVVDLHHPVIEEIRENHADEILIIDLAHYMKWTDIIDQICSCECILSSSLHGLIVSDTYQVPNCWIELSGKISGGYFKYFDYASSVKRDFTEPFKIESLTDIYKLTDNIFENADLAVIKDNQNKLVEVAPFHLKI